ncbi:hypothetical protein R1sor_006552 [Riccia sorocarpa]|uniref:Uncharacterized protein n=1 Tax=Riccia sorocarpa TaxID=122646 RepID=A0ABD3HQ04_9MARC
MLALCMNEIVRVPVFLTQIGLVPVAIGVVQLEVLRLAAAGAGVVITGSEFAAYLRLVGHAVDGDAWTRGLKWTEFYFGSGRGGLKLVATDSVSPGFCIVEGDVGLSQTRAVDLSVFVQSFLQIIGRIEKSDIGTETAQL